MSDEHAGPPPKGPIAWMAHNAVASNLLMVLLVVGGLVIGSGVKKEVFPEFDLDYVLVTVPYPGASPAEVEQGIVLAIEEAVRGLDGVKRVSGGASENVGSVYVELLTGADPDKATADVKNAVDRITTFPQDAERPAVSLLQNRQKVISFAIHGELEERTLREVAELVRDDLINDPEITQVELDGLRPLEISVEVDQNTLRTYGMTLDDVANRIRAANVELPAGGVRASGGEVLVRTNERRYFGVDFGDIPVVTAADGTEVLLGDVATIRDGYAQTDEANAFFGEPAIVVNVFRIGDETPVTVADATLARMGALAEALPDEVSFSVINDRSEMYRDRMDLMLRNAAMGFLLVLLILGLFLELRLAFWVTMGIPISFAGSLLLMPVMDVSVNMISMFAFIVTLGMVVDDAIVVGENIFYARQRGLGFVKAAVEGAKTVATPVTFAILTTVAAFAPMFFVPGVSGKIFRVIPAVVVSVLILSLIESLFILPAHLAHQKEPKPGGVVDFLFQQQQRVTRALDWFIRKVYRPQMLFALRWRYATIGVCVAIFIVAVGYIAGGRIDFAFLPKIEGDQITAKATMPYGTAIADTEQVSDRMLLAANEVIDEFGGPKVVRGIYTRLGAAIAGDGPVSLGGGSGGSHLTGIQVRLVPMDQRDFTAAEFTRRWREKVGDIAGVESLMFRYSTGPSAGDPVNIELSHRDMAVLDAASKDVAKALRTFEGVTDIDDGFQPGKPQLDFVITPYGESLGLTSQAIAQQVRHAFFGAEAVRQQRGRHEMRVYVRLPEHERSSEHTLEEFIVRLPAGAAAMAGGGGQVGADVAGGEVPLRAVAEVERGRAYTSISRTDGRRVVNVTADLDLKATSAQKVLGAMASEQMPEIMRKYPGLTYGFEGEARDQGESLGALGQGFMVAMLVIFMLLAIPFRSYILPVVVMFAIPFGLVGALIGHVIMGFEMSIMSMFGVVALSGVVVNDSLVLVERANRYRDEDGWDAFKAVAAAAQRRFRPILLTSLTTFFGLLPMIFETSVQARFLIPMALSLGFGVLFATFIILLLVPSLYVVVSDLQLDGRTRAYNRRLRRRAALEGIGLEASGAPAAPEP